eukprot:3816502-Rhodomonas_salina.1
MCEGACGNSSHGVVTTVENPFTPGPDEHQSDTTACGASGCRLASRTMPAHHHVVTASPELP